MSKRYLVEITTTDESGEWTPTQIITVLRHAEWYPNEDLPDDERATGIVVTNNIFVKDE